jgi:hypothetical protein
MTTLREQFQAIHDELHDAIENVIAKKDHDFETYSTIKKEHCTKQKDMI